MPNYVAVSRTTHASKRWNRHTHFAFAARDAICPLVAQELPKAQLHLPIAFVSQESGFIPVAVLGLQTGKNLFVAPNGRWLGGYIPANYRSYPFALASNAAGQQILICDEDSGLINETGSEPFFDPEGNAAPGIQKLLDFLTQVQQNRILTQRICNALAENQLIQPWPITLQTGTEKRQIEGLHRIDETALNALPAEAFEALRQSGALPIAYCQLLSMQHLPMLSKLAEAHQPASQPLPTTPKGELDLEFLHKSDTISFGKL